MGTVVVRVKVHRAHVEVVVVEVAEEAAEVAVAEADLLPVELPIDHRHNTTARSARRLQVKSASITSATVLMVTPTET